MTAPEQDPFDRLVELIDREDTEGIKSLFRTELDPNGVCEFGWSPLAFAVYSGKPRMVKLLMELGGLVERCEFEPDSTVLHEAAERGFAEVVKILLDAGGKRFLEEFDYVDRTPLMCAAQNGNLDIASRLIDAGANVNAHNEARAGDTALSVAVSQKNQEMVKLLLEAGADPRVHGWMRMTPLDRAKELKRPPGPQILELLENAIRQESWLHPKRRPR